MDLEYLTKGKNLTTTESDLLLYLASHVDQLEGMSLRQIAQSQYTSPATLVRLAQKLNFSGYLELFYFLKSHHGTLALTNQKPFNLDIGAYQDAIEQIKQIYSKDPRQYITIYANGFSGIIGEYLHKKLLVNGVRSLFVNATDSSGIITNNTDNMSMLICISKSGETEKVIEKMRFVNTFNIPTVLFTGNLNSSAAKLASITLQLQDDSPTDSQNRHQNHFFANLILLLELVVHQLTKT